GRQQDVGSGRTLPLERWSPRMRKLLFLASLSLATVTVTATEAPAWFLSCCHCRNKCCTTICCKPYNAFSPVCCGNITTDCCPINFGGYGMNSCFAGGYGYGGSFNSGCCDGGSLPAPSTPAPKTATQGIPSQPIITQPFPQGNAGPQFIVPNPQPIHPQAYWQQVQFMQQMQQLQQMRQGYAAVEPVGYFQPSYGATQAPSYWYGR